MQARCRTLGTHLQGPQSYAIFVLQMCTVLFPAVTGPALGLVRSTDYYPDANERVKTFIGLKIILVRTCVRPAGPTLNSEFLSDAPPTLFKTAQRNIQ